MPGGGVGRQEEDRGELQKTGACYHGPGAHMQRLQMPSLLTSNNRPARPACHGSAWKSHSQTAMPARSVNLDAVSCCQPPSYLLPQGDAIIKVTSTAICGSDLHMCDLRSVCQRSIQSGGGAVETFRMRHRACWHVLLCPGTWRRCRACARVICLAMR